MDLTRLDKLNFFQIFNLTNLEWWVNVTQVIGRELSDLLLIMSQHWEKWSLPDTIYYSCCVVCLVFSYVFIYNKFWTKLLCAEWVTGSKDVSFVLHELLSLYCTMFKIYCCHGRHCYSNSLWLSFVFQNCFGEIAESKHWK